MLQTLKYETKKNQACHYPDLFPPLEDLLVFVDGPLDLIVIVVLARFLNRLREFPQQFDVSGAELVELAVRFGRRCLLRDQ